MGAEHLRTVPHKSETQRREELLADRTPIKYKPGYEKQMAETRAATSGKFTHERRAMFLFMYAETGQKARCARLAGVQLSAVYYRTNPSSQGYDSEFVEMVQEAEAIYAESIEAEVHRRGVEGWKEPVWGGKDKDKIVGYIRRYSDRLLELHVKKVDPRYRDKVTIKQETDGGGGSGPMSEALSNLDHDQRGKLRAFLESVEPRNDESDVIDVEAIDVDPKLENMIEDI